MSTFIPKIGTMKDINNISLKLKKMCLAHNFTQDYVAKQIQVSRKWYGMLENVEAEPKEENLIKIATLYKVTIEDIKNFDERNIFSNNVHGSNNQFNQGYYFYQAEQTILSQNETISTLKELIKSKDEIINSFKK